MDLGFSDVWVMGGDEARCWVSISDVYSSSFEISQLSMSNVRSSMVDSDGSWVGGIVGRLAGSLISLEFFSCFI